MKALYIATTVLATFVTPAVGFELCSGDFPLHDLPATLTPAERSLACADYIHSRSLPYEPLKEKDKAIFNFGFGGKNVVTVRCARGTNTIYFAGRHEKSGQDCTKMIEKIYQILQSKRAGT